MSPFPLGARILVVSPSPSRGSCRSKRDLSGNGDFNMALEIRSLNALCQEPWPFTLLPLPTHTFPSVIASGGKNLRNQGFAEGVANVCYDMG